MSSPPPRLSKISPRIKYFLVVFAVTFTPAFVVEHFLRAGNIENHPGVLLENEPSGKSAALALVLGLIVAFLTTKKKFD